MFAQANGIIFICQHEAEHHLHSKHQGMKIPNDSGLIQEGDSVSRGDAAKGFHTLLKQHSVIRRLLT